MTILWLTFKLPYPCYSGTETRVFNLMKRLSVRHDIHLVSFAWPSTTDEDITTIQGFCKTVSVVRHPFKNSALLWLKSIIVRKPYKIIQYSDTRMNSAVRHVLANQPVDLVLVDHLFVATYAKESKNEIPVIITAHNVESHMIRRYIENGNWMGKLYGASQCGMLSRYERKIFGDVNRVICVSEIDRRRLVEDFGVSERKASVVDNGVDTAYFDTKEPLQVQNNIIFTGSMYTYPNRNGLDFFMSSIFPLLKKEWKDLKLYIVGDSPPPEVRNYHDNKQVFVTGRVEDVRPYFDLARVAIVPLRIGGGSRLKILEALSMGKPVVSTSIGCEGLQLGEKQGVLVANTPKQFVDAVGKLLKDDEYCRMLSSGGRRSVVEQYDWEALSLQLESAIAEMVEERA